MRLRESEAKALVRRYGSELLIRMMVDIMMGESAEVAVEVNSPSDTAGSPQEHGQDSDSSGGLFSTENIPGTLKSYEDYRREAEGQLQSFRSAEVKWKKDSQFSPLVWWKEHRLTWPALAKVSLFFMYPWDAD
jgi:hypothetical protein